MAHDVFISYSTQDKPIADAVCAGLEQRGVRCWIAPRDILAGMEWGHAIVEAISSAKVMVLLLSANANKSTQIPREVDRAMNKGVTVIPLRIEDVQPAGALEYYLGPAHWLDALTPPLQSHIEHLARTVTTLLDRRPGSASAGVEPSASPTVSVTADRAQPPPVSGARPPAVSPPGLASVAPGTSSSKPAPPPLSVGAPRAVAAFHPLPVADEPGATPQNTRVLFYILSAVAPLVGVILWAIYKDKPYAGDKQMAQVSLIIGICSIAAATLFGCFCVLAGSVDPSM